MRFMTYNILEGAAGGERLRRVTSAVQRCRPDVLALMECNGFDRDGQRTMFELERVLGMRGVLGRTSSGFHLALFVRNYEILEAEFHGDWFHHGALRLRLEVCGAPLTVIATHLCPFSGESRIREAQYLTSYARGERVVVMGDMNNISQSDLVHLDLPGMLPFRRARHLVPGTSTVDTRALDVLAASGLQDLWPHLHGNAFGGTLPTPLLEGEAKPVLRLDYIFASTDLASKATACEVVVDDDTRSASDHYPVWADITL